ncbi:MAG TPA: hypothetical protein ENN77_01815, partial [Candidatus Wirthbacteria bacterium]|nr:hypothetical protein [Candidatus Wirthbacteria bacterium]
MNEFIATTICHKQIAPHVYWLGLDLDGQDFTHQAGQFISVLVGEKEKRPYSVCSVPLSGVVELCISTKNQGNGSKYIQSLDVPQEVRFLGPFGNFVLQTTNK